MADHVRLVPLGPEHGAAMLRWMRDPSVRDNVGVRNEPSEERTQSWLAHAASADDLRGFAILFDGRHVGNAVLDRIDRYLGTARLSIYIGERDARGIGVGRDATRELLRLAFHDEHLFKVWLTVHEHNQAAIALYGKIGFRVEGRLRGEFLLAGERVDALLMGILAAELG